MNWEPFDYSIYESGLFWFLTESRDADKNGNKLKSTVLAFVEEYTDGSPNFGPVDPGHFGEIWDGDIVTHFAKVTAPSIDNCATHQEKYNLYKYRLSENYQYDGTRDYAFFIIASSQDDAEKRLKPISNRYTPYNIKKCNIDELKEYLKYPGI